MIPAATPGLMECEDVSRNAASSRAIPVTKKARDVLEDTAMPLYWGANQRGMQADGIDHNAKVTIEFMGQELHLSREEAVEFGRDAALALAKGLADAGYHKQICNRYLEPYGHITVLVSATEWSNFLALRDHADAEPHMRDLAMAVRAELEKPAMQTLQPGEWHMPFITDEDRERHCEAELVRKSCAHNASTSYKTVDGFDMTMEKAQSVYDGLLNGDLLHASPGEHTAKADFWNLHPLNPNLRVWQHPHEHGNFKGFRQHRKMLPNECL